MDKEYEIDELQPFERIKEYQQLILEAHIRQVSELRKTIFELRTENEELKKKLGE